MNNSSHTPLNNISAGNEINAKAIHFQNVDQNIITITEDRVKLALIEYLEKIESKNSWNSPLGILMTLLLTVLTTDKFKNAFSIPAYIWQAIFYISIFLSIVWLLCALCKAYKNRNIGIDNIIKQLKSDKEN